VLRIDATRLLLPFFAVLFVVLAHASVEAKVFHSRESALKIAFPRAARVEPINVFLTSAEQAKCSKLAKARCEDRIVRGYAGYRREGGLIGHAFIDTHVVRTMPETFMLVVAPNGTVIRSEILAFHEPQEYLPSTSWLRQFVGKKLSSLRSREHVDTITGATLTATALTAATRRLLAVHKLKLRRSEE
jgi:hypothetical protein